MLRSFIVFVVLLASADVHAQALTAQVTDVADAADKNNVFDFNAWVGYRHIIEHAAIVREYFDPTTQRLAFGKAYNYDRIINQLDIRAQVGLYHDLEFNFYMPYIFNADATWRYPDGVNDTSPTVVGVNGQPLFGVPFNSYQNGLKNADFGLAWSPFNDARDDTKPTWTLRVTYSAPIGAAFLPGVQDPTNANAPAPIGDKIHRLIFEMALSKRLGVIDPYVSINYVQPFKDKAGPDGQIPQYSGGFATGFELVPWDDQAHRQRLSLDFRGAAQYFSAGRTYSELTNPLGRITNIDNYANVNVGFHLLVQPIEFVRFTSGVMFGYNSDHFITNEPAGVDANRNNVIDQGEFSNRYNDSIDAPGRRFAVQASTAFTVYVNIALTL